MEVMGGDRARKKAALVIRGDVGEVKGAIPAFMPTATGMIRATKARSQQVRIEMRKDGVEMNFVERLRPRNGSGWDRHEG